MQRAHGADWWPILADGVIVAMTALAASHADAIPGLETLAAPVLLCQGGADPFCPAEHHAAITAALPRARQVFCATAGHLLAWHAAPAFDDAVAALLAEHP
jgi:pimeloyl-ACP methyl ester carboxylesterase